MDEDENTNEENENVQQDEQQVFCPLEKALQKCAPSAHTKKARERKEKTRRLMAQQEKRNPDFERGLPRNCRPMPSPLRNELL